MKQFAILIAAVAMIGFFSSESFADHGHKHRHGGTSWGVSIGNGYGSGFSFGQGYRGNHFYGLNLNSGYGYYPPPVYAAPVYAAPVVPVYPRHYGGYGGGFYHRGCGGW